MRINKHLQSARKRFLPIRIKFGNGIDESNGYRRSGRTTRMIDKSIQQFFDEGVCEVYDHHGTREADKLIMQKILKRLHYEHGISESDIVLDWIKLVIRKRNN